MNISKNSQRYLRLENCGNSREVSSDNTLLYFQKHILRIHRDISSKNSQRYFLLENYGIPSEIPSKDPLEYLQKKFGEY